MELGHEIFCIVYISLSSQVSQLSISLDQVNKLQKMTKIWLPFECVTKQFLICFNQRIFMNSFHSFEEFQILVLNADHSIPLSTFLSHPSAEAVGIKTMSNYKKCDIYERE